MSDSVVSGWNDFSFSRSQCIKTSIEVSLFENTYFVNKLYIEICIFAHFLYMDYFFFFWYNRKPLFIEYARIKMMRTCSFEVVHCQNAIRLQRRSISWILSWGPCGVWPLDDPGHLYYCSRSHSHVLSTVGVRFLFDVVHESTKGKGWRIVAQLVWFVVWPVLLKPWKENQDFFKP